MGLNLEFLYGIYDMTKIEAYQNGEKTPERVNSGMYLFTRDQRLCVVSGSNEMVISYTGSFSVKEDTIYIQVEACNFRDREGKIMTRKIIALDENHVVLEVKNDGKGSKVQITWSKKISL